MVIGNEDLQNRFGYHKPKDDVIVRQHETMRNSCLALAKLIDAAVPDGREKAMAIQHLEATMMWANAAIARNQ